MTRRVKGVTAGLVLLATGLAGCTGSAGSPPDASPTPTRTTAKPTPVKVAGTVNTSKKVKLSLRKQPTIESDRLARIPHKTRISMSCKTIGTTVSNGTRASNVWTKVTYKKKTGYVSSVFVKGGDSAKLSVCQTATVKPSATPTRPPNVEPAIIQAARSQKGVTEKKGKKKNCTPYGGCMPWSSLFATWAWNKAGDSVPRFSFSGDLYNWGKMHDRAHDGVQGVGPGDFVLYDKSPKNSTTSTHVDIVIEVLPDNKLRVIGGDVKNKVTERTVSTKGIYGWVDA